MIEKTVDEKVRLLVENLASSWNGGQAVLTRLAEQAGNATANPYEGYRRLGSRGLEQWFSGAEARQELDGAVQSLESYLAQETWFDRMLKTDKRLQALRAHPVAYFCAEYGLEDWLPIYSGGLGILAGDVLKEASDLGLPFVAIGLFYRRGFFFQGIDNSRYQTEIYPTLDPADFPLTPALDSSGNALLVSVPMEDRTVHAAVWRLQVGRTTLYLLDTDTPENERPEDRSITAHLYGGDSETRIQQELVLGVGGERLLRALGIQPSVYSMNEGHAAFLGIELLAEALRTTDFEAAIETVRGRVVYTNHTVVPAGNDVFSHDLVRRYLGPYVAQSHVGIDRLLALGTNGGDQLSMAILAFRLSGKANAVSKIHADAIHHEWPGYADAVQAVTNGVHIPSWAGPEITALLDRYVTDWRGDAPRWEQIHAIPDEELWAARRGQRESMLRYIDSRVSTADLDPDSLTLVWARRFAEYKRAGLLASDIGRLSRLMSSTERPLQIVVAGKAHPRDDGAKRMMQELLQCLESNPSTAPRFVFVPDYRIALARVLVAGADVWVNTPRKPLEASGTSGMKSSDNGGLQLTVTDGWAAEVEWWNVGWGIEGRDDGTDARQFYEFLEDSVVPTFYTRNPANLPETWLTMMRNSMVISLSRYSTRRMVQEYVYNLYLPLIEGQHVPA